MSKKSAEMVSDLERQKLAIAHDALDKANRVARRAAISLEAAKADYEELMFDLSKRYKLKVEDAIDTATGAIARKATA